MEKVLTAIPEICILKPCVHGDSRGYFMETYNQRALEQLGIMSRFVQDNESFTEKKGTLRGIHFQNNPYSQAKIVRITRGAVIDVAVDLRKGSPTYLKWVTVELSAENKLMLYIPCGFGHGFVTLTDGVEFCYKVDAFYNKECDRSIRYDDPAIGVNWGIDTPILSDKDKDAPLLRDSDCNFRYEAQ